MAERPWVVRHGAVAADLLAVEPLLVRPETRILKDGARGTVAVVPATPTPLVVKRFREHTALRLAVTLALGSSAHRVWQAAALMRKDGFPIPEPVAALERRRFGIAIESCAIMRWVDGPALDEVWPARAGAARRALTIAFADYLRRLHAAGLYPQDLRAANVIVARENPPVFVLVDLDRVRRYRRLSWHRRRKNVVQVHRSVGRGAPRREALRFLRRYLGNPSGTELRRVADEILALGRRKDAEYARRRGAGAAPEVHTA
jgi:hypothetical protein